MPIADLIEAVFFMYNNQFFTTMKKDKQDEQQRHAQRDALISKVFRTMVHDFNKSCDDAYILIGRIWGLGERQIQKILKRCDESALSADDFAEFVVILQRISEKEAGAGHDY